MDQQERARDVQHRLEVLWHKLEGTGAYVGANTVHLAQELIKDLTGVDRPDLSVRAATAREM
jgi:hypothetical protein